ncbi:PAS domain-containing sensor histidine kinase [Clostridium sp. ZS2-4]|uniref:PAS domain-containing sensor histidine kinase n=1 Tax=Clostridium sp. ZS2-4 TaxID=2987703 RepID=UPI002279F6DA|nr:PAS domain-containing protein [Clostridium sp. ZS2-4]MCY6354922.1 PAS domain S-box protein [Clostridium sp. ZS2-4]
MTINHLNFNNLNCSVDIINELKTYYTESLKYKKLFNNDIYIVLEVSADGKIFDANKAALQEYGYSLHEIKKLTLLDLRRSKTNNLINYQIEKSSSGAIEFNTIHYRKDGSRFYVKVNFFSVDLENKKVFFSIIKNITEEKLKGEQIEKLSKALEQASSAIIITDVKGKIEYANKKFEEVVKKSRDKLVGRTPHLFDPNMQPKDSFNNMWNTIKLGKEWKGEYFHQRRNGTDFWWDVSIAPVKDDKGEIIYLLGITDDITEKKNMLKILNNKNLQLNDTLTKLKDTQMKLIQEDKMASIGQLSAGIAHEINNPLGFVISNFTSLKKYLNKFENVISAYRLFKSSLENSPNINLENEITTINEIENKNKLDFILEDLKGLLDDTNEGLERVRKIVIALRVFSHENNANEFEEYNINSGLKNTLIIANNEIKYTANIETNLEDIPLVEANSNEINQVLLNILVNAAHAIKEKLPENSCKSGIIKINTYKDEKYVYCSIEDNGVGIPVENMNKIFNPFFTTKAIGKGTGFGLSISYDIIKNKHKGDLIIESEINVGTKVIMKIPICQKSE